MTPSTRRNGDDPTDAELDAAELDSAELDSAELDSAELDSALTPPVKRRASRIGVVIAVIVAVVIAAAIAFSVGRLSTLSETAPPANDSAEAGFVRDMKVHHDQGVELSLIVRDLTTDVDVRRLAYDILTTQGAQSGAMSGWLQVWGLPEFPPEPSMTWMTRAGLQGAQHNTHGTGDGAAHTPGDPMPGLATPEQIAYLKTLTGVDAEIEFLDLMIAHHRGAVQMAEALIDRSTNPIVTTFAQGVINSQQAEIDLMQSMLAERGAPAA